MEEAKGTYEDGFLGEWGTLADYAASFVEDACGDELWRLPALIAGRIDYEGIGHNLELSGDIFTVELGDGRANLFDATR